MARRLSAVPHVSVTDVAQQGVQEILSVTRGARVVKDEKAVTLDGEEGTQLQEHVLRSTSERPTMNNSNHGSLFTLVLWVFIVYKVSLCPII